MEACSSNGASKFDNEKALKGLLDAFGDAFSLKEIASAYCKAGKDADLAAETLSLSTLNGEAKAGGEESSSSRLSIGNMAKNPSQANGSSRASKPKYRPVSSGSVSSIIGKQYVRKTPSENGSCNGTKPLKLDSKVLPMPESWAEKAENAESSSSRNDRLHQDMEDFLFSMLGDGFKLERDVIRQVLDSCGYDMEKSMDKLVTLSASSDERNEFVSKSSDKSAGLCLKSEVSSQRKYINSIEGNGDRASNTNGVELNGQQKVRNNLQKEVLTALFNAPERPEGLPRRSVKAVKIYGAYGHLVVEPPKDSISECKTTVVCQQHQSEDDADDEDSYQVLRKAVKEYRSTMKEYYQAAVDAFSKGDRVRAGILLERGQFFHNKACEADEELNNMIVKTRDVEAQDEIVIDLHERGTKEAIRLLKCHLSSFAGISSIKHLKAIIDKNEEDISKGSRRRLSVLKLLEEESIKWVEGENAGTILIQLDSINRKRLTFNKK